MTNAFTRQNWEDDAAENSIMQTITIAVSAILIAAGLVTAPGLINNARDNNARTELANIAYAEEFQQGENGKYIADYAKLSTNGIKLTPSDNKSVIYVGDNCYASFSASKSGKVFYRVSGSAETKQITDFSSRPSGYPASCEFPSSLAEVQNGSKMNALLAEAVVNEGNLTGQQHRVVSVNLDSAKGYTVASAWRYGDAPLVTLGGSEMTFKVQAAAYQTLTLVGTGSAWTDAWTLKTVIPESEQSKDQWSTTVIKGNETNVTTKNGNTSVATAPTKNITNFEVNGYTAGNSLSETVGTGKIYTVLAWDRALTADEQKTVNAYLANIGSTNQ
jgi:hypothetical protein